MNETGKLKGSLKLWQVVILGLGYLTPMTVYDSFGIVSGDTGGFVPTAYILALIAMLFTAYSYGKMVQVIPDSGSAYTYTQKTISPHLGFLVGWSSLLDYIFLPMVNALLTKIYLAAIFPGVPTWLWVILFVAGVTTINLLNVTKVANFNTIFVLFQILVMVFFVLLAARDLTHGTGYGEVFTIQPFFSPDMKFSSLVAGATVLCFSFLGFDAITTLSEETREAKKNIPRGIFLTALLGGMIFITVSYFTQALFPDLSPFHNPEAPSPEIALYTGGKLFQSIFLAGTFMGTIASGIASHTSVSRLLYAMGRDGVLPKRQFSYVHPKWGSPAFNVILVGAISLVAIFINLEIAFALINFGALIAFSFVHLSVIAHYAVRHRMHQTIRGFFQYVLIPLIGAFFITVLWFNLKASALMIGLTWSAIGIIYLLYLTRMFRTPPPQYSLDKSTDEIKNEGLI
ncbi:APC family permease [Paludifilum halophilum]|uniref:Putrescine importer PuuP n=1 Tax=Paludifilum halophilum TaxID=1642702 RepID=A0A235BB00_9BACL|nr:APC family permease [Paludifilum halophilum]OYD09057.1 Putrescine importer PuuP [Paludifilum halophilum]